jgi:hypothetical protein
MMLYIGPDVVMPLVSAIAAVVGVIVMFWQRTVGVVRAAGRRMARLFGREG